MGLPIRWFDLLFFTLPQDKLRPREEQRLAQAIGPITGRNGANTLTLPAVLSPARTQHLKEGKKTQWARILNRPVTPQTWRLYTALNAQHTERAEQPFPECGLL